MKAYQKKVKEFIEKYERYLSPGALIFGFIVDILTLTRVDLVFDNFVFLFYLTLSGIVIWMLNAYEANKLRSHFVEKYYPWLRFVLQFAFGGMFSGFVVLYSRSASIAGSWPFILVLVVLFLSNEFSKDKTKHFRLVFQLGVYFLAIFSYLIFAIPVVIDHMGPGIFIASGIISLFLIRMYVLLLERTIPWKVYFNQASIVKTIGLIFIVYNFLYFTNIIPPIPLSLKDLTLAHSVTKQENIYTVQYEDAPWYKFYREFDSTYHWRPGMPVYVYSSVYAPAQLRTKIVHEWSYHDGDDWIVVSEIIYPIAGGRKDGYRGYSVKNNISPGKWRVDVQTERGQMLGRTEFEILESDITPELKTKYR
ncbi:MAG: DUF2914 domain-containing protein [Parcubacteria group bacterium]